MMLANCCPGAIADLHPFSLSLSLSLLLPRILSCSLVLCTECCSVLQHEKRPRDKHLYVVSADRKRL